MSRSQSLFLVLALVMALTRFHLPNPLLHLADASWAVLFLAGFYLAREWRWAFPALMVEAVAIDYAAIRYLGVSNYCVTLAYSFLLPAYGALWLGGAWLQRRFAMNLRGLALLCAALFVSVTLCYAISNASFYWLGGRVAEPNVSAYVEHFFQWYASFLRVPFLYVGIAALLHLLLKQFLGAAQETRPAQR